MQQDGDTLREDGATLREGGDTLREGGAAVRDDGGTVRDAPASTPAAPAQDARPPGWLPDAVAADYRVVEALPARGAEADIYVVGPNDPALDTGGRKPARGKGVPPGFDSQRGRAQPRPRGRLRPRGPDRRFRRGRRPILGVDGVRRAGQPAPDHREGRAPAPRRPGPQYPPGTQRSPGRPAPTAAGTPGPQAGQRPGAQPRSARSGSDRLRRLLRDGRVHALHRNGTDHPVRAARSTRHHGGGRGRRPAQRGRDRAHPVGLLVPGDDAGGDAAGRTSLPRPSGTGDWPPAPHPGFRGADRGDLRTGLAQAVQGASAAHPVGALGFRVRLEVGLPIRTIRTCAWPKKRPCLSPLPSRRPRRSNSTAPATPTPAELGVALSEDWDKAESYWKRRYRDVHNWGDGRTRADAAGRRAGGHRRRRRHGPRHPGVQLRLPAGRPKRRCASATSA